MCPPDLSDRDRAIALRVLGPARMAALHAPAADSPFPEDGVRIPLHEALLLLEYQTGWLKEPVQKVDDALDVLLNIDFSNGRQVGRKLSSAWDAVIEAVAEALGLAGFLDNFGTDDWESVVDWARADLERTSLRALETLEELAPEPDGGGDASEVALGDNLGGGEPLGSEISGIRDQLAEVNQMDFPAPSPGEAQWAALGGGEIADQATDAEFAAAGTIQIALDLSSGVRPPQHGKGLSPQSVACGWRLHVPALGTSDSVGHASARRASLQRGPWGDQG